ncbi:alanine and proline-rich secreted protein Apa [Mycobacterium deserti]|uniref:Alanine and proline-rich secreted protein Apa n=1 Tax=Mycobacterium deserti TaxID=2978347 RepID=A0ABT2MI42_9MYCO|nr:alanine and proline-rich secreted protein Apa [Mycobacterium deserti]MCT7661955.1 alanine and proline-rich secreted protein Apa [Mycobacterium deserti]
MDRPDAISSHRTGRSKKRTIAALTGATAVALTLPIAAQAQPEPAPPPPPPAPSGNTFLQGPPPPPGAPPAPGAPAPAPAPGAPVPPPPPADPNAVPADPNAAPPPAPEAGRVEVPAGGLSFVVPAGWKLSDSTQLSYGQALLTKDAPEGAQPPNDTSVLLGRLDLKLFAGAETDNTKAAQRLASDMGEFFMPFPGTRLNQESAQLDAAGMPGVASYYEVKFTDANKPTGQIWAGVVGTPTEPGTPRGQRAPERWFVVWLGTANNPVPKDEAVTLANSIRPFNAPPPPPAADPNAPAPAPDPNAPPPDPNAPAPRPGVGVAVPVAPEAAPGMLPPP